MKRTERSHGCCEKQRTMLHQAQQRRRLDLSTNSCRKNDLYATLTLETTTGDDGTCAIVRAGIHKYLQSTFSSQLPARDLPCQFCTTRHKLFLHPQQCPQAPRHLLRTHPDTHLHQPCLAATGSCRGTICCVEAKNVVCEVAADEHFACRKKV